MITLLTPSLGAIAAGIAALLLLVLSGFASGSEIAFFSLSPADINCLEESGRPADRRIMKLRGQSERTLATILITNNLVNVSIIMLSGYFFAKTIAFGAPWLQFLCMTVALTFLLLLFGEIMPKVYCAQQPLRFCRLSARWIAALSKLFHPFSSVLMRSGILAEKVAPKDNHQLTIDDLEQALTLTDKDDIREEKDLLEGIVRFGDETAKEIMTSRKYVVDLNFRSTFPEVIKCIVENNYSRIPVYQNNIDNVRGILYIKDLLPHLNKPANFRWQSLIRPPYFVPETKKIDDLLRDFQENKVHIAIVVDEFGGTSGIVTMEDILEEIVGEINDEYDDERKDFTRLNANTYIFDGKTLLSDFCRALDIDPDTFADVEGDADSLGGLLLELKEGFPSLHEKITCGRFTFETMEMADHSIKKIKVVRGN